MRVHLPRSTAGAVRASSQGVVTLTPPSWRRTALSSLLSSPASESRPLAGRLRAGPWTAAERPSSSSFLDPVAYDRMTGTWSRRVGEAFLDWLALPPGLRWLDAGCGGGAFTGLVIERCAPASVEGIDPEPAQVEHARGRQDTSSARFTLGDATDMPYAPGSFDVAVMALVLVCLPEPARGVAEMVRVLAPGGVACAYNWDLAGGGSPLAPLALALRQAGVPVPRPPPLALSGEADLQRLWENAGLQGVCTRRITVRRQFESFEQAWEVSQLVGSTSSALRGLGRGQREEVKARFRDNLQQDTRGPVTCMAVATAVQGRVPAAMTSMGTLTDREDRPGEAQDEAPAQGRAAGRR